MTGAQKAVVLLLLGLVPAAPAQSCRVARSCISAAGRAGAGTSFRLNGTAGQVDQGQGLSTGFAGYWGFWYGLQRPEPGPVPGVWQETGSPVPNTPTAKAVKQGGWLAYHGTTDQDEPIFVHKGYKTTDFYAYFPESGVWQTLKAMPYASHPNEKWAKKMPYKGCKGIQAADVVYVTQGNNTLGFWSYHLQGDSWHIEADVPEGPDRKKLKGGTDMTFVPAFDTFPAYVYLLKGYKREFYRFDTEAKTWDEGLDPIPVGEKDKVDKGSWVVYNQAENGEHVIYGFKSKYHELYPYLIESGSWGTGLSKMPLEGLHGGKTKRKKAKDGGSAVWYDGDIYALKGGNSQQFFLYQPDIDRWAELETVPSVGSAGKKRRVKYGADIVHYGSGVFYALKGNKTREVWRYTVARPDFSAAVLRPERNGAMARNTGLDRPVLTVGPSPVTGGRATVRYSLPRSAVVRVRVFDAAGRQQCSRLVPASHSGRTELDLKGLSAGVYLVWFEADGFTATRKLVLQR